MGAYFFVFVKNHLGTFYCIKDDFTNVFSLKKKQGSYDKDVYMIFSFGSNLRLRYNNVI